MKNSKKWISFRLDVQNPEALSNNLQLIAAPPELVPPLTEQPRTESIPMHLSHFPSTDMQKEGASIGV